MREKPLTHSPEHWRRLASDVRTMADGLATEANRRQMLAIAESYLRLADEAEEAEEHEMSRSSRSAS
jgi:hypothetical protein